MDFTQLRKFVCKFELRYSYGEIIVFAENEEMAKKTALELPRVSEFLSLEIVDCDIIRTQSGLAHVSILKHK